MPTLAQPDGVPLLVDTLTDTLEESAESTIELLPTIALVVAILLVGLFVARVIKSPLRQVVMQIDAAARVKGTPLESAVSENRAIVGLLVFVVQAYILLFTVLIAAEVADVTVVSEWAELLVRYVPAFLGGILIFLVGIIAADVVSERLRQAPVIQGSDYGEWVVVIIQGLLLVIAAVIGLEMVGFELQIVYIIADGLASAIGLGIAAAIALAIGVVAGFFARDYAKQRRNIDD